MSMEINIVKIETPFKKIPPLDIFRYCGELYMKLPEIKGEFDVYVGNGLTSKTTRTYNAVHLMADGHYYTMSDCSEFIPTVMVIPVKSELTLYEAIDG